MKIYSEEENEVWGSKYVAEYNNCENKWHVNL